MLRRTRSIRIGGIGDIGAHVAGYNPGVVLVVDVDNTLVRQGAGAEEFRDQVNDSIDRLAALPGVQRVVAISNGPPRGVERMINRGNKPWTTRRRLGLGADAHQIVVVGDQVLTDGVLAWRLGATHLHLVIDAEREPRQQAVMRRLGRLVERLIFLPQPAARR